MTSSPRSTTSLPTDRDLFARDVLEGLAKDQPELASKWFYDARGTELFRQIMKSPDYYLTNAEADIFRNCAVPLLQTIGPATFDLIELGAGDGSKTQLLIERFLAAGAHFSYRPVDLSATALAEVRDLIKLRWPKLDFEPLHADYFEALDRLGRSSGGRRRLILFPGANIGNFAPGEAVGMLRHIGSFLGSGDLLLTGFDLKKDPARILSAYNDAAGLTAEFNLNLLRRINRELQGDFDLSCWRHWETYDPAIGAARSFLVPVEPQRVRIKAVDRTFHFRAWQPIRVEISQKYSLREIEGIADAAGFDFVRHFQDGEGLFTDSLFQVRVDD